MNTKTIDFDLIKKYCGQDLSTQLQGAISNLHNSKIKIVNTGMVSSGKSSLYNVLTENTLTERFPTGAARTTMCADSFCYRNVLYIDTPGIDVKDIDDEIAFSTIVEADIVVIVHNIKTGPLTRAESEWIKRISASMPNEKVRKKRLLFVCTWKDMREKEEGYETLFREVCNMVFDAVGTIINVCDVSVLKYQAGLKKEKPILCKNSGIPELREIIDVMGKEYSNNKMQYAREQYIDVSNRVEKILRIKNVEKQNSIIQNNSRIIQKYNSERMEWNGKFKYFSMIREGYDSLQEELRNM